MKKFIFLALGLLAVLTISAGNYVKNETTGMYLYTGAEVDGFSVDFTTWTTDSLYDAAVGSNYTTAAHTLSFTERANMGFQKWVIYPNRWIESGLYKTALFNNGQTNNTVAAEERPFVYFPAIKGGVKEIVITGKFTWFVPYYYDATAAAWKSLASVSGNSATYQETTISFESVNATMVAFSCGVTAGASITGIEIVSKSKPEPTPSENKFVKNETTGMYLYTGEEVNGVNVDFTTWTTDSLYDAAVGSNYTTAAHTLSFTERANMGFQKWVIYPNRWLASGVPNQTALFNNGQTNNTVAAEERPFIYFPAVKGGVKEVKITGVVAWVTPYYYNASTSSWKSFSSVQCGDGKTYKETTISFSDKNATMVALSVAGTSYSSITNLQVTSKLEGSIKLLTEDGSAEAGWVNFGTKKAADAETFSDSKSFKLGLTNIDTTKPIAVDITGENMTAFTASVLNDVVTVSYTAVPTTAGNVQYQGQLGVAATDVLGNNVNESFQINLEITQSGDSQGTALENTEASATRAKKIMCNGQIYIIKNGVTYNLLGDVVE